MEKAFEERLAVCGVFGGKLNFEQATSQGSTNFPFARERY
jgi:hypothetical protein